MPGFLRNVAKQFHVAFISPECNPNVVLIHHCGTVQNTVQDEALDMPGFRGDIISIFNRAGDVPHNIVNTCSVVHE